MDGGIEILKRGSDNRRAWRALALAVLLEFHVPKHAAYHNVCADEVDRDRCEAERRWGAPLSEEPYQAGHAHAGCNAVFSRFIQS